MTEASRPKRILVVDDEEDVQVLVCRILKDVGYEIDSARDGGRALERIAASRPDLVVLDLMMPVVDGWEVLERLRGTPNPPPVIVLTARGDFGTFTRGVREGAAAYVFKPFRFHELVATCQRVLLTVAKQNDQRMAERRRDPRRVLMVEVKVLSKERAPIALGELVNLSSGGSQVDLGVPLEPGVPVRVAFNIPGGADLLGLDGRVQWRVPASQGFSHGLAFTNLAPGVANQLAELLRPPSA